VPCGAGADRHENIGEGYIGHKPFKRMLAHPAFQEVPFILEVPGLEGHGPDKSNLDLLKRLRPEVSHRG
jgi:deoxyribonuclease IV